MLALTVTATTVAVIEVEKETHFIENGLTTIFEGVEDGLESTGDFAEYMFNTQNASYTSYIVIFNVNKFELVEHGYVYYSPHRTKKNGKGKLNKHQRGERRKLKDMFNGEKGDRRRTNYRKNKSLWWVLLFRREED